ncbi:hypothetical protein Trydic_g12693 [Trypoxylus dichotomus]
MGESESASGGVSGSESEGHLSGTTGEDEKSISGRLIDATHGAPTLIFRLNRVPGNSKRGRRGRDWRCFKMHLSELRRNALEGEKLSHHINHVDS